MADYTWAYWTGGEATAGHLTPTTASWLAWNSTEGGPLVGNAAGNVWTTWVTAWGVTGVARFTNEFGHNLVPAGPYFRAPDPPPETEEQRQERERRAAAAEMARLAADVEARARRVAASARAEALLLECLTPEQANSYRQQGHFFVRSQRGRRFRVRKGWSHNVELLNTADQAVRSFCIHPIERVPDEDNMLAQKLMLEHDEDRFMRTANQFQIAGVRA